MTYNYNISNYPLLVSDILEKIILKIKVLKISFGSKKKKKKKKRF